MRANVTRARAFGRRVAEAQDEALREEDALSEARALWLAPTFAPRRARRAIDWPLWGGVATAATLATAACFLFLVRTAPAPLAFQVGPSEEAALGVKARPGVVGELVAAPVGDRLPVHFSDGSTVRLEPDARARIVEVADNGSRVLLESGVAHASVVHRADTRWSVQAGAFEVRVTGTQFDVGWDPAHGLFSITLIEGRVVVSGCAMERPRVVSAGETFRATCKNDEPVGAPVPLPAPVAIPTASSTSSPTSASIPIAPPTSPTAPRSTWRELLSLHRYAEAFDDADAVGLSSICASADVETLMDLGDAARFAGHSDRAKVVLQAVRRRFAADEQASTAAFNLGRIAFDDEAAYPEAARWFDQYLTERPTGALAREASGRRMEALARAGDHAAAKSAAERYLRDFPAGPHADLARSIADR
jgi:transmembrane sensor